MPKKFFFSLFLTHNLNFPPKAMGQKRVLFCGSAASELVAA